MVGAEIYCRVKIAPMVSPGAVLFKSAEPGNLTRA